MCSRIDTLERSLSAVGDPRPPSPAPSSPVSPGERSADGVSARLRAFQRQLKNSGPDPSLMQGVLDELCKEVFCLSQDFAQQHSERQGMVTKFERLSGEIVTAMNAGFERAQRQLAQSLVDHSQRASGGTWRAPSGTPALSLESAAAGCDGGNRISCSHFPRCHQPFRGPPAGGPQARHDVQPDLTLNAPGSPRPPSPRTPSRCETPHQRAQVPVPPSSDTVCCLASGKVSRSGPRQRTFSPPPGSISEDGRGSPRVCGPGSTPRMGPRKRTISPPVKSPPCSQVFCRRSFSPQVLSSGGTGLGPRYQSDEGRAMTPVTMRLRSVTTQRSGSARGVDSPRTPGTSRSFRTPDPCKLGLDVT